MVRRVVSAGEVDDTGATNRTSENRGPPPAEVSSSDQAKPSVSISPACPGACDPPAPPATFLGLHR